MVILVGGDCPNPVILDSFETGECDDEATEYSFATVPGTTYSIFVGAGGGTLPDYDYVLSVCGFDVVGTENATWGGVKSLFR